VKVGVAGLGLIGGSLLRALGGVGYDGDPAVREIAAAEGFEVAETLEGLEGSELVLVAVPPWATATVVAEALAAVPDACVADTASVKTDLLAAIPRGRRFVGAHPMAGGESAGWAASSPGVIAGATWAACPASDALEPLLRLSAAVDRLDGRLVACTAEDHDDAVARVSHVPHLAAQALAGLVAGSGLPAALSGPAFRDMTRVARSDPELWAAILSGNRDLGRQVVGELIESLQALRLALDHGPALREAWERGGEALAAVDASRAEPDWREEPVAGWAGLLALGRQGRAVRRLRLDGGDLHAEVAR
jgi:prephenate dehydrogenase